MKKIHQIAFSALLVTLTGCASIGSPDGGPYDETPPKVVSSSPNNKAVDAKQKKISILFDEYIKMENASEKVTISPPQTEMPNVRADGKHVKVTLYDSLQANTTYTIDFSDAIVDNNEGNPLGKYTFSFSTGPTIDTMEVSGTVLTAENLEPVKGIMVGLYPLDSLWNDSVFTTSALTRVGRTNGSGQFTVKGVKNGQYRAFALKDMDGNYFFSQKSEMIAFDTVTISTSKKPDLRPDTIWADTSHIEKIRMVPFIHYYPDNLVLHAFLEAGQDMHLLKTERQIPDNFRLYFTAPQDTLPQIKGVNFHEDCLKLEASQKNDTLTYWITDTVAAYQDTLSFALTYLDTDTTGIAVWKTDTLDLVPKTSHAKLEKERMEKVKEWEKDREKHIKKAKGAIPNEQNPYTVTFMDVQIKPSSAIAPNQNIHFTFGEPIENVDSTALHFYTRVDSDYVETPYLFLPVDGQIREYCLYAEWEAGKTYRFVADSLAFTGALGHSTRTIKQDIRVRPEDEFGTIYVRLVGSDENCIVQLMNKSDKPINSVKAENGRADFFYLKPGDYYLRMFIDRNDNGEWDTGDYATGVQPEEVFYFPKPLPVRAKFEVEQPWDYRGIDFEKQKPKEITKQKADKQKSVKDRNKEREKQLEKQKNKKK